MPKFAWMLTNAALLGIVAALDHISGTDLQFSVFYFVPIALTGWHLGPNASLIAAVGSSAIWWGVDVASGRSYRTEFIEVANYTLRLVSFVGIAVVFSRLRQARDDQRQLNVRLETTVRELQSSMLEIDTLRNEMQRVCAWTNRIQSEGKWVPMDQFLTDKLHLKITHGISEEGVEKFRGKAERADDSRSGE